MLSVFFNHDKSFKKKVLKYHILELVLTSVFNECMSLSSVPNVSIFKHFKHSWAQLNVVKSNTGMSHEVVFNALKHVGEGIINFATDRLQNTQPRADYMEFLE